MRIAEVPLIELPGVGIMVNQRTCEVRFVKSKSIRLILLAGLIVLLASCSIKKMAINTVISALSGGGGTALTGDSDPELVADALPFALKLYEILLEQSPENVDLLLTTGTGFVMYSNAFVQMKADMLPADEFELRTEMRLRSRGLYLRGRDYVLKGLDIRHPGFLEALNGDGLDEYLAAMNEDDVPFLYWSGAGWFAAIALNAFDIELGITRETALALMFRALEIDESYSNGAIHEFFIQYYGSMPEMLGGSEEKARFHFERAIQITGGTTPGPYVSLAQAVSIKNQDIDEFRALLGAALEIEADDPATRLVSIMQQRKASWLLDHVEDFILF